MHYGQYKQVALTTPSNACYARSPKPIWASKRNRGHGKRRHNNRQFKCSHRMVSNIEIYKLFEDSKYISLS